MTMTVQLKRKKKVISKQLQEAIDSIPSPDFEKLQPKVDRVFAIGRDEGLSDKEIGKLVRGKMKEYYNRRTITRVFEEYPDAKQTPGGRKRDKMSHFDEDNKGNDDEKETDKYQHYKQVIESKNKLLKQKDEEIKGLKEQLAQANKRIKELESKQNKPKPKKKVQGTAADKAKLLDDAMQFREGLIGQERRRSSDE